MTIITSTENLKTAILKANPDIETTILEDLLFLTRKHNLKWVSEKDGSNAYYIMSQLSIAKGLDAKDYVKHWVFDEDLTSSAKRNKSESLPGRSIKFTGEKLAKFKQLYQETYNESLGRAPAVWVGDWEHSYAYLVQGRTETAKDFQTLGSKAVETAVKKVINQPLPLITEEQLQDQIIKLAGYSNVNFRFEVAVFNPFQVEDQASHRRWDWVENLPRVTKLYELKAHTISERDIQNTIFNKHYLELAAQKYPNKPLEFIFTSPKGISWEAKDLIKDLMKGQEGYTDILGVRAKISFIDLQDIAQRLVTNIVNHSPIEAWFWILKQLRDTDLKLVCSDRTISKLNGEVSKLYSTGALVRKNNVIQFPTNTENDLDEAA